MDGADCASQGSPTDTWDFTYTSQRNISAMDLMVGVPYIEPQKSLSPICPYTLPVPAPVSGEKPFQVIRGSGDGIPRRWGSGGCRHPPQKENLAKKFSQPFPYPTPVITGWGNPTETWTFTYDGDGVRAKEVYTNTTDTITKYYFAGG